NSAAGGTVGVVLGDFNNDGNLDLASVNDVANTLSVRLGTATGTFGPRIDTALALLPTPLFAPTSLVARDFNHDGKLDLLVASGSSNSRVQLFQGLGNGNFQPVGLPNLGIPPGLKVAAIGDLDADPTSGAALILLGFGEVAIYRVNPDF